MILDWFRRTPTRETLALQVVRLEAENAALQDRLRERELQVNYWRERAERYIDIGMAQAGKSHEPVMTGPGGVLDALAQLPGLSGAGVMEIDSRQPDGRTR